MKDYETFGDIVDAIDDILENGTEQDAQDFMAKYRAEDPEVADSNIGYLAGYYDAPTAKKIWAWFGTRHPVFGTSYPGGSDA